MTSHVFRARRALTLAAGLAAAAFLLAPVEAKANPSAPWIQYDGQTGPAVECIQLLLINCASHQVTYDKIYGPETRQAVMDVQRFFSLPADGIVGPDTGDAFKVIGQRCLIPYFGGSLWDGLQCEPVMPTKH